MIPSLSLVGSEMCIRDRHTPKNLLIRAVRTGKRSDQGKVEKMLAALNIHPTLDRLLNEKEQEGSVR